MIRLRLFNFRGTSLPVAPGGHAGQLAGIRAREIILAESERIVEPEF